MSAAAGCVGGGERARCGDEAPQSRKENCNGDEVRRIPRRDPGQLAQ
jgi:hypothetical protein